VPQQFLKTWVCHLRILWSAHALVAHHHHYHDLGSDNNENDVFDLYSWFYHWIHTLQLLLINQYLFISFVLLDILYIGR
jgi:hypothetical protein